MTGALHLSDRDEVAVLIDAAAPGDAVLGVAARDAIPSGHKMALRPIATGAVVHKYGQPIGVATRAIGPGEHVHNHNLALPIEGIPHPDIAAAVARRRGGEAWFDGYVRADGGVGTRNTIGIIASVNCSATVVRRIARTFEDAVPAGIDAVVPFTHSRGCGMAKTGEGIETLERTLTGYARHPNFGGVLMIGLGCEVAQIEEMLARYGLAPGERLRTLTIQGAGGTAEAIERGTAIVHELIEIARTDRRQRRPASDLVLGLQCGGSDGWSGVTANPALGVASDLLIAAGGTAYLSETPEIYGAEHLLYARATSPAVADALAERVAWWEAYAARHDASLDNNPSPGNKAGGLTTIYEKSLGAVAKAGNAPLDGVLAYAGQRDGTRGLIFMDSPGYDPCSATGQIASGANLLAFTTGRGSVFGAQPTPCLKIASNAPLARRMSGDMDIDCSPVLDGWPLEDAGRAIFDALLAVASGRPTKSEAHGLGDHEFVPWQLGAWM
ncbi:altronate dehydratase family protein [Sphingomonas sp. KR1UV-12]|uniref:Altronate dehydratase family protein n=1 Tax=Sphingomonas aurea TaxID=3063994 RepID=A0ABT9EPA7_9SPHN|nr:altronate dehydratase family protein [Sphingomonas sp. KR1UV-12]MDP1028463.1 altronate dehydratase family protein [Sphingomonas sp. KR1UV-12]